ncbi:MAG: 3-dehydroquinate synthase [Pyrinomonadaceae bacterium]|nr:3-dehydroquinate synthase [Pyrinomonadaceae bacterium]
MLGLQVHTHARQQKYEIRIGRGLLTSVGANARRGFGSQAQRVVLVSNRKVFEIYGPTVIRSIEASGFTVWPWLIGDGERHKSMRTVEGILRLLAENRLDRNDGVIALGGGVVGDVAGFVAATYLRGISVIQIPTTLLAQIDSAVGGKTGVNLPAGKNLVGAFHQPRAVIIDIETLATLPSRELVAGWCESVKQGAVASRKLFKQTTQFLARVKAGDAFICSQLEDLIAAHCAFKASIVAADEREDGSRSDRRSRRILNFGHTIAHALEVVTAYRRFRHGEAVGYGVLVAAELSKHLGLLPSPELELLRHSVRLCGPLPLAGDLDAAEIAAAIARDKKSNRGQVQWVLLRRIGRPLIVDGKEISARLLQKTLRTVLGLR